MLIFTFYLVPLPSIISLRMLAQISPEDKNLNVTTPYYIFKYSIRSEVTRRYYERRIRTFFDFIQFLPSSELEKRCNIFAKKATRNNKWAVVNIIRFLQYEKERVEKGEITAATLSNFVKSIKLYCEMCDATIHWKKITRGLPRPRLTANDRALEIDPEMLEALFNKGLLLYAEDKKEEALTWIDKALIIDPTNQQILDLKAQLQD